MRADADAALARLFAAPAPAPPARDLAPPGRVARAPRAALMGWLASVWWGEAGPPADEDAADGVCSSRRLPAELHAVACFSDLPGGGEDGTAAASVGGGGGWWRYQGLRL